MFFWNSPAFSMIQQMLAIWFLVIPPLRLPSWLSGKESAWNAGNARNIGSFPGSGRPPAEGHVNPLRYSCLENPMDRETWRAIVHKIAKSWTWLKWPSTHTSHRLQIFFLMLKTFKIYLFFEIPWQSSVQDSALSLWWPRFIPWLGHQESECHKHVPPTSP